MKIGLVLEGGGMRGLYTIGVLDCLMDKKIEMDYCIGVSAGACNGISYVSGQRGRSFRVNTKYLKDKRYLSLWSFMRTKSLFGMDFLFGEIPDHLEPFDYKAFFDSPCEFVVGVTDVEKGKAAYFTKRDLDHDTTVLRASSSLPVFSPIVPYQGGLYLDGGTSDPIPVGKALADGCDKVVVVCTRPTDYVKAPESLRGVYRRLFSKYPAMIEVLNRRHEVYNRTKAEVAALQKEGRAYVLAPAAQLPVGRFEKREEKLKAAYQSGYRETEEQLPALTAFMGNV